MQQLVIEAISDKDDFYFFLAITSKCLSDGKTQDNPDLFWPGYRRGRAMSIVINFSIQLNLPKSFWIDKKMRGDT